MADVLPWLGDRIDELAAMGDVKHLDVRLNRLRRWYLDGLLCIGDAAHAMSPIGGVGINLAIQDAVAAAALLADPLRRRAVTTATLQRVQARRRLPTIAVQALQRLLHRTVVAAVLQGRRTGPSRPLGGAHAPPPAGLLPAGLPHRRRHQTRTCPAYARPVM